MDDNPEAMNVTEIRNEVPEAMNEIEIMNEVPKTTNKTEISNAVPEAMNEIEIRNEVPEAKNKTEIRNEMTEAMNEKEMNEVPETTNETEISNEVPETTNVTEICNAVPEAMNEKEIRNAVPETTNETEKKNEVPEAMNEKEIRNDVPETTNEKEINNAMPEATNVVVPIKTMPISIIQMPESVGEFTKGKINMNVLKGVLEQIVHRTLDDTVYDEKKLLEWTHLVSQNCLTLLLNYNSTSAKYVVQTRIFNRNALVHVSTIWDAECIAIVNWYNESMYVVVYVYYLALNKPTNMTLLKVPGPFVDRTNHS